MHHFLNRRIPSQPKFFHIDFENAHSSSWDNHDLELSIIEGEEFYPSCLPPSRRVRVTDQREEKDLSGCMEELIRISISSDKISEWVSPSCCGSSEQEERKKTNESIDERNKFMMVDWNKNFQ